MSVRAWSSTSISRTFFPTVTYCRVNGVFARLGYSEAIATILALLTTEPEVDEVTLDDRTYFVAKSDRRLPQGAPTSPALTNRICRRLDHRLTVIGKVSRFCLHSLCRRPFVFRRCCVVLFECELTSCDWLASTPSQTCGQGKTWGSGESDVISAALGFANFVAMDDASRGAPLVARARALQKEHRAIPQPLLRAEPEAKPSASQGEQDEANEETAPRKEKKKWWNIF